MEKPPDWELMVPGVPASLQAKTARRQGWKARVAAAARAQWAGRPLGGGRPAFKVIFYHEEGRRPDVDNIIKYTQDGLSGIVYDDDVQLIMSGSELRDVDAEYVCRGMSPATAAGFMLDMPFVVVQVWFDVERPRRLS